MNVRTRMAPSPTGRLHVGTARTALFNYLFARKHKGAFVLRIEDTDVERSDKKYEQDILDGLTWLGLAWDEGPFRQSERLDIYEAVLKSLLANEKAFYCSHDKAYLDQEKKIQMREKQTPRHVCSDRDNNLTSGIIRMRNDATGSLSFENIIRGTIVFDAHLLGDFSLAKDTRTPLYNLAVVADDHAMDISHVIRGEDHISNTPKQILIQRALGYAEPFYAHLPLILGSDKSKLSKRDGATSLGEYKTAGYLPEALINMLALLGWSPGDDREIFSLTELEKEFSLERVQKSGAVFNPQKLDWLNAEHIRKLSIPDLAERIVPFLTQSYEIPNDRALLEKVAAVEQPRLTTLAEIGERAAFFFTDPVYEANLLRWKGTQAPAHVLESLNELLHVLDAAEPDMFAMHDLTARIMPIAEKRGRGETLWPLRVALSGRKASPDPLEIMSVIGKDASLRRIRLAQQLLSDHAPL